MPRSLVKRNWITKKKSAPFELAPRDRISCIVDRQNHFNNTRKLKRYEVKSDESKSERTGDAQSDDGPARLDNGGVGESTAGIPDEVAHAVQAVVGEGKGQGGLDGDLGGQGESTHGSNHGGGLEVPAEGGRGEVCGGPKVESAGEGETGDTVQGTADPADLGTVDGQVRSDGAVQALLGQDLGRVLSVGRGGDGSRYGAVSLGRLRMTSVFWGIGNVDIRSD